jgi:hypothetical protein
MTPLICNTDYYQCAAGSSVTSSGRDGGRGDRAAVVSVPAPAVAVGCV